MYLNLFLKGQVCATMAATAANVKPGKINFLNKLKNVIKFL